MTHEAVPLAEDFGFRIARDAAEGGLRIGMRPFRSVFETMISRSEKNTSRLGFA